MMRLSSGSEKEERKCAAGARRTSVTESSGLSAAEELIARFITVPDCGRVIHVCLDFSLCVDVQPTGIPCICTPTGRRFIQLSFKVSVCFFFWGGKMIKFIRVVHPQQNSAGEAQVTLLLCKSTLM